MTPPPHAARADTADAPAATILCSFDVDGTLMRSVNAPGSRANALHKQAFSAAWERALGLQAHIDDIKHDGGTDALILLKMAEHCGVDPAHARAKLPEMQQAMLDYYFGEEDGEGKQQEPKPKPGQGLELLPGAKETLEALAARGPQVATCLVTGNLEPIGWAKMQALGIDHLFSDPRFGGFGSDHCGGNTAEMWRDRAEFVRIARRRCAEEWGGRGGGGGSSSAGAGVSVSAHWHVGDTPADILAAVEAGASAIAVATGAFGAEDLQKAADEALAAFKGSGGDGAPAPRVVVLEQGLRDVSEVLAAMGLS